MIRHIRPGDRGLDFSFRKPPPKLVRELGYQFVIGYLSRNPAKNLLNPEDYIVEDLGVGYVWEINAARTLTGYPGGLEDGQDARNQAEALGQPVEVPILAANDTATTTANSAAQRAYMEGFRSQCLPYGIYAGTKLGIQVPQWSVGWMPSAWSWSIGSTRKEAENIAYNLGYHVLQHTGFWINENPHNHPGGIPADGPWNVDPNEVIRPITLWGNPREEDMKANQLPTITCKNDTTHFTPGSKWAYNGVNKRRMTDDYGALFGAFPGGVNPDEMTLSDAALLAIPDYQDPTSPQPPPFGGTVVFQGTGVIQP